MGKKAIMLIMAMLIAVLCGCASSTAPVIYDDAVGEYEELAAQSNEYKIQKLLDDLLAAGDYENAGYIVNTEHQIPRMVYDYASLCKMFAGHEEAVDIAVWTDQYKRAVKNCTEESDDIIAGQLELVRSYHSALYKHFGDDRSALSFLLSNGPYTYKDQDHSLLSRCGTAASGKVLVYTGYSNYGNIELGLTAAMPEERLPSSPEEVEYILMLKYPRSVVGSYTNGAKALRIDLDVSILHYPEGKVLAEIGTVKGGAPPSYIGASSGDRAGSYPGAEAVMPVLAKAFKHIETLH